MYDSLFSKTGLNLDRLRRFCEVAEAGSTVQAAAGNRRPQPSYSRDVLTLEEFFGFPLFAREVVQGRPAKRITGLTPQGRGLLTIASEFLRRLEGLQVFSETPQYLRIGGGETVMHWLVAAHMDGITSSFPKTTVSVRNCEDAHAAMKALQTGELDCAVVEESALATAPFTAQAVSLGTLSYALYIHREDISEFGRRAGRAALARMPWIALEDAIGPASETVKEMRAAGVNVRLAATVSSFKQVGIALRGRKLAGYFPTLAAREMRALDFEPFQHELLPKVDVPISLLYNEGEISLRPYLPAAARTLAGILAPGETGAVPHSGDRSR